MKKITAGILFLMLAGFDQAVHAAVAVESSIDANVGADTVIAAIVLLVHDTVVRYYMALCQQKFAVEVNPLIHIVEEYSQRTVRRVGIRCMGYAEPVVQPRCPPNLVTWQGSLCQLTQLTGKRRAPLTPDCQVRCAGTYVKAGKAN